ncbi:hypothetical protein G4G28_22645 [Massilia sp. Dwa41.01b]|uniref:hypothetical protein n=1 Tax=unclassified Massilia TaxID=2609279 RepID=UPI001601FAF4|nr:MULTISPECIES: hypothetical protein [unclassified Massilia]QNA90603.1 hypothetical protein G4G28_22645 [Massilia sp. Dwa41.01b]QNA97834.1 hypothetical protein G4G31_01725 [Massilia sp. Se16.2.3]
MMTGPGDQHSFGSRVIQISLNDVRNVFQDVLHHRMTREAADRWAYSIMQASEGKSLEYVPPSEQDRIWAGVMFLLGADLQESPGQYLFSDEAIHDCMLKACGDA